MRSREDAVNRQDEILIGAVGDVLVDRADPTSAFSHVREQLGAADILFGNCEGPYTDTEERNASSWGWLLAARSNLDALPAAGFNVMSLANNHIMDAGYRGLSDTLDGLRRAGVEPVGAGADRSEARKPVFIERGGVVVGFLAYTCVYPPGFEAWDQRPGCATVEVHTHYRGERGQPGTRPVVRTAVEPDAKDAVLADVQAARSRADVLVVSAHWGIHNLPAVLADYERELGRAVIDAGADLVLGHHQHIIKGIEMYRGKPIFYGVGNFLFDSSPEQVLARSAVAREAFRDFAPFYGEHLSHRPESKRAMLVRCRATTDGLTDVAFVPCAQSDDGEPTALDPSSLEFAEYLDYLRRITEEADLSARFTARDGEILVEDRRG
jgi:poly-gamma-glutamate capsule biosynthesis protein CapA/YwtB (metallophosphatase superfamily)